MQINFERSWKTDQIKWVEAFPYAPYDFPLPNKTGMRRLIDQIWEDQLRHTIRAEHFHSKNPLL